MSEAVVKGRLLRWGNSVGVRISRRDVRRLRLREGSDVTLRIESKPSDVDLGPLPVFHGKGTEGKHHDQILGRGRSQDVDE